jgi:hypothetical protein
VTSDGWYRAIISEIALYSQPKDIEVAHKIWGPSVAILKGKTTRSKPAPVVADFIKVPKEILDLHKEITLSADIFFVNQIPFFLTISHTIHFTTATHLSDRKIETVFKDVQGDTAPPVSQPRIPNHSGLS